MSNNSVDNYSDLITVEEYSNDLAQITADRAIKVSNKFKFISPAQLILLLTLNLICLMFIVFACAWVN
jgi:hypothetical protein